jgi:hypothetical protein
MPALASHGAELLAFHGRGTGLRAALMSQLKRHRLPEHLIESFIREAMLLQPCGIDQALTHVLEARMRLAPLDLGQASRIFLIGPSGSGVSSVARKLHHRAGALGKEIRIESQSFHPRNLRARTAFASLVDRPEVDIIGVVSALADAEETGEIIAAFRLNRLVVTGLDMASRLGALITAITQGAFLAHVTRSPNDGAPLETLSARELAFMLLH